MPDPAKKLASLLKRLRAEHDAAPRDEASEGCPETADRLLWQFVYSFLAWESTTSRAGAASKRLHGAVVDYNEMRVALPDELAGMIGDRYPKGAERAARLRSALNDLYKREHAVSLARIATMAKRDARTFLESLEGTPHFVAARMLLLALGGHAFPVDDRMLRALVDEGAVPPELEQAEAAGWLERQFRAGEAAEAYLLLERWLNERPAPKPSKRPARREHARAEAAEPSSSRRVAVAEKPRRSRKPDKD